MTGFFYAGKTDEIFTSHYHRKIYCRGNGKKNKRNKVQKEEVFPVRCSRDTLKN